MFIRFPVLLLWNLLRNLVRFPFVLLQAILQVVFGLFVKDKKQYIRLEIRKGLPYWERSSILQWFQSEPSDLTMDQWRDLLKKLGTKKNIEGMVLEIRELHAGWPVLDEFRTMLLAYREQGKRVVLYPHQLTTAEYYLATGADKLLISPATPVMLNSPAFQSFFFGAILKEVGVSFDVQRMGAHKNAPENMTRAFPSPTYRGDLYELLFGFTQHMFTEMAKGRDDDPDRLRQIFAWGVFSPEEALQHELIDAIRFSERLIEYLKAEAPDVFVYPEHPQAPPKEENPEENSGPSTSSTELRESEAAETTESEAAETTDSEAAETTDSKAAETADSEAAETTEAADSEVTEVTEESVQKEADKPSSSSEQSEKGDKEEPSPSETDDDEDLFVDLDDVDLEGLVWWRWTRIRRRPLVAVIPVAGTIVDEASSQSRGQQADRPWVVAAIEEARQNPQIKGVVLWVNSPGGSGFASEAIWWALKRLGEEKPVITYMDSYAASGGYYVACGTQKIVASPWCITGSIGVFGGKVSVESLMQRLKIGYSVVGESAGLRLMSPFRSSSDADKQRWLEQLALFYDRFLMRVAEHRDMSVEEVHEKAQGKVYLGEHARELGLVDQTGHLSDAVKLVCDEVEIPIPESLYWLRPSQRLRLSDLRDAMQMGTTSSLWRMLKYNSQPSHHRTVRTASLCGPDASLVQNLLTEQTVHSALRLDASGTSGMLGGVSASLLQQLPMQEYLGVMQMIAGGDIAAWCDIRWK